MFPYAYGTWTEGTWFGVKDLSEQKVIADMFLKLPYLIEVDIGNGKKVGMVHGDIGGSWTKTKDMIKDLSSTACRNDSLVNSLIWDRTRIQDNYNSICEGIDHVFLGHTPLKEIKTLGNCTYIDTGSCFKNGYLTILDIKEFLKING